MEISKSKSHLKCCNKISHVEKQEKRITLCAHSSSEFSFNPHLTQKAARARPGTDNVLKNH